MRKSWHHRCCPVEAPIMNGWDRLGADKINDEGLNFISLPSLAVISLRSLLSEPSLPDD